MQSNNKSSEVNIVLQQLQTQKAVAIDQLLIGMTVLACIGVPISLSRALHIGWSANFTLHTLVLFVGLGTCLFRSKLSTDQKSWIALSISTLVAVFSLYNYGFVSNGLLWGCIALLITISFLKRQHTYLILAIIIGVFLVAGWQFISGRKSFPGGADLYLMQLSSWGTSLIGGGMFFILIISLSVGLRRQQNNILLELEKKNRELDAKNAEISRLANFDDLTGLPVLRRFRQETESALQQQQKDQRFIALCFIDLDGFKTVNDNYGHSAGDCVLQAVAQRLLSNIRQVDTLTRMGGDEFAILLNSAEEIDLDVFCARLLTEIRAPYAYENNLLHISASIGAVRVTTDTTFDELLKSADNAMYTAKHRGKDDYNIAPMPNVIAH